MITAEKSWRRAVTPPPFYISFIRLKPLSFGKYILLDNLSMLYTPTLKILAQALHVASHKNYESALDSIEFWHWRLLFAPNRLLAFLKRKIFIRFAMIMLYRKRHYYWQLWKVFVKESVDFPNMMESDGIDSRGLETLGVVRAVVVSRGLYNSENVMNAPFVQVLHDYAWVLGIRVENDKDVAITESLKRGERMNKEEN